MLRIWMIFSALVLALGASACATQASDTESAATLRSLDDSAMETMEEEIGGRIGVALMNERGETLYAWRGDERFAMCSTFKLALAAAVLERVEEGEFSIDDSIVFDQSDILSYAPVTSERVAQGEMTVAELAEAIITLSDNTAANLLLDRIGGPAALTTFFRDHGDEVSRLDRMEPELNENAPGDPRDTTSPVAMASLVQRLMFEPELSLASREQLGAWAIANETGDERIRAGIPDGWRVGDKTGTCGTAYNDIGIVWPPEGDAFVLAVYIDRPEAEAEAVNAAIADIARLAVAVRELSALSP
ncbi:class A beta-lactamase [uncultured Parasphingopyxis sp.]|uniref:class A beta-lactamase n=1 Tax=uncultured Parasphingopyxis sp. TaxID=1547918 RepID=UPI00262E727F|nr:class A beta-lactamase [uncultured Parasphingopyxis sp.]